MGTKRGQGRGSFVTSVVELLDAFYGEVVQTVKPWAASAPKLREPIVPDEQPSVASDLVSTALSSQDGPQPAEQPAIDVTDVVPADPQPVA